jgi:hypothetical protein
MWTTQEQARQDTMMQEPVTDSSGVSTKATREHTQPASSSSAAITDGKRIAFDHELTTLDRVQDAILTDDKGKWDIVLPRSETVLRNGKLLFPDSQAYECESGLSLSPGATGQICSRLNIPTAYFKRCPEQLQDAQYNYWNTRHVNAHRKGELKNGTAVENNSLHGNGHAAGAYPGENGYRFHDEKFSGDKSNDGNSHHIGSPQHNGNQQTNGTDQHEDFTEEPFGDETSVDNEWDASEPEEYRNGWAYHSGYGHQFKNGLYAGTEKSEYWLLRARHSTLRAVLTDRYTPLDNRTLLDCLHRTLPAHLQVQWLSLDDEAFHLRIIDPSLCYDVLKGDPVMAGLHIANSETGRRSVTVDAIVFRQVCSNGLIKLVKGKSILSQRHVAVSPPHFVALLRQSFQTAFTTANSFVDQMTWATTAPIQDVESEMKSLVTHWHLSQSFVEQVQESLGRERSDQQETVYGLTNALTAAAQTLDADARYDVEVLAGKLLERKSLQSEKAITRRKTAITRTVVADNKAETTADAIEAAEVLFEAQAVPSSQMLSSLHAVPANDTGAVGS